MERYYPPAPELQVAEWLNAPADITLASLRGRVVLLHAFQMRCPACVSHGVPQAQRAWETFGQRDVVVLGLHTVFENHAAMHPGALRTFVQQNKLGFPVGIDSPRLAESIPATMHAYQLQGTPSTVLIDARGRIRLHHLGYIDDLRLGMLIGRLVAEIEV